MTGYAICAADCDDVTDCGPAPQGGTVTCAEDSCFISCADQECPEEMECISFGGSESLVCMFPRF
jgi:hypothetical protein